jgi:hypothetical protein
MNTIHVLHNAAMEFYDLAKIAKAKGKSKVYEDYLQKAYVLDKEAALKMQSEPDESNWKYIFARSAGWLAFHCGNYEEARIFAELGLSGNPPVQEKSQLTALLEALSEIENPSLLPDEKGDLHISGILASANLDDGEIKIRENGKKKYRTISVSKEFIQNIARFYLGELVEIEASEAEGNRIILKHIKRAA